MKCFRTEISTMWFGYFAEADLCKLRSPYFSHKTETGCNTGKIVLSVSNTHEYVGVLVKGLIKT